MEYRIKNKKKQNQFVKKSIQTYFMKAAPFLKWAGGKTQLLSQFNSYFINGFNKYIEPFVGGGAVFFHLYSTGMLNNKKVTLLDLNDDLINCYRVIKNSVDSLISVLSNGKYKNDETVYYKIREETPDNPIEKAARIIYLNKTCYNGLYRVNQKGKFNVPFGSYKNPLICNENNLKAVSIALKNVKLVSGDFNKCLKYAQSGDFIYLDPPYHPITKTSSFTSYTSNSFTQKDQLRLAEMIKEMNKRNCRIMLSNSDDPFIKNIYHNYNIEFVKARRAINCNGFARGKINELVIYNY